MSTNTTPKPTTTVESSVSDKGSQSVDEQKDSQSVDEHNDKNSNGEKPTLSGT
jgi:hypothetical protein